MNKNQIATTNITANNAEESTMRMFVITYTPAAPVGLPPWIAATGCTKTNGSSPAFEFMVEVAGQAPRVVLTLPVDQVAEVREVDAPSIA